MLRHALFFFAILPSLVTIACAGPEKIDFARDVQPLLAKTCIRCHGAKLQESNYRLDVRQVALAAADRGDAPIVPGDADASPLFRFVSHTDPDGTIMPPEDEGKSLDVTQVEILREWINQGAVWPDDAAAAPVDAIETDHWSFQPLERPAIPDHSNGVADVWCANLIDLFVREQICGDALDADAATGFLVGGPYDLVKSPDINLTLMQRQDELADIVNTTGTTFLGLTLGCARCHNHKFDPIPQRDYYAMQAVFAGVNHGERAMKQPESAEALERIAVLKQESAAKLRKLEALRAKAKDLAAAALADGGRRPAVNARLNEESFEPVTARFVRFTIHATSNAEPCIDELEIYSTDGTNVALAATGAVATASGTLPGYAIHQLEHINDGVQGNDRSWISNTPGSGWVQIELPQPTTINQILWGRDRREHFTDRVATDYVIKSALEPADWHVVSSSADRDTFDAEQAQHAAISYLPAAEAEQARGLAARITAIEQRMQQLSGNLQKAWIGTFSQPERTHRLYRGDPMAKREVVAPDALTVLGSLGMEVDELEQARRLRFADWISRADNPLTARVIVNRLWHYHFGTGIVATPSDFGVNGARPTHSKLLDWLAAELVDSDWSLKHVHRLILTSSTFCQTSRPRPEALQTDANSRLLWRFPPRRLAAETIRDSILAVSGSLNRTMGGPGFSAFEVQEENVRHYFPRKTWGPKQWRRMVYMTKVRQEQDSVFGNFDCPDGNQTIPSRSRSTTPLQALNLFNSPFVIQQCHLLAGRLRVDAGVHVDKQVRRAFQLLNSRDPDNNETRDATRFVSEHGLESFCRAMLSSNEFLFIF